MIATALFLYDGDCGFCTRSADVLRSLAPRGIEVVPYQRADLARFGVTAAQCRAAAALVALRHDGTALPALFGAPAIARTLRRCAAPWPAAGRALDAPGIRWAAARVYRWVAAHRSTLPWPGLPSLPTLTRTVRR